MIEIVTVLLNLLGSFAAMHFKEKWRRSYDVKAHVPGALVGPEWLERRKNESLRAECGLIASCGFLLLAICSVLLVHAIVRFVDLDTNQSFTISLALCAFVGILAYMARSGCSVLATREATISCPAIPMLSLVTVG